MFLSNVPLELKTNTVTLCSLFYCFLDGLRIVGRADRFAYGNLPAQGYGKRSILPLCEFLPTHAGTGHRQSGPSQQAQAYRPETCPSNKTVRFIISYLIYKIIQNRNLIS